MSLYLQLLSITERMFKKAEWFPDWLDSCVVMRSGAEQNTRWRGHLEGVGDDDLQASADLALIC